jgi:two-component system, CitB family, sensor kinase
VSQVLTDRVVEAVEEPALTALLLGKAAEAHERGIAFDIASGAHWPPDVAPTRDVVTIVGNLIDNALDAVAEVDDPSARRVAFDARVEEGTSEVAPPGATPQRYAVLDVSDTGPGLPPGAVDDAFRRGWSTKEQGVAGRRGIGLALVAQTVDRLGGTLSVSGPPGARFTVRLPARLPERVDPVQTSRPAPAPTDATS